jgi:acyl-CoA thioesterase
VDPFPGLDMRKVDMTAYNKPQMTLDHRQLQYYRVLGAMPSVDEDPNMHAAAHLYASDRNGLFPVRMKTCTGHGREWDLAHDLLQIPNFLGLGDNYSSIASLSHTVVFHLDAAGFSMLDERDTPRWFCIEESIDHISGGRGLAVTRIWDVELGTHIVSTMQDGMLRMKPGVKQSLGGDTAFEKIKNREKQEAKEKEKL